MTTPTERHEPQYPRPIRYHGPEYHGHVGWYVGWSYLVEQTVHRMVVYVLPQSSRNLERAAAFARAYEIAQVLNLSLEEWVPHTAPGSTETYRGHDDIQLYHRAEGFL